MADGARGTDGTRNNAFVKEEEGSSHLANRDRRTNETGVPPVEYKNRGHGGEQIVVIRASRGSKTTKNSNFSCSGRNNRILIVKHYGLWTKGKKRAGTVN